MIKPSPGRIVLYRPDGHDPAKDPHAALLVGVIDDRCINLVVFNEVGGMYHAAAAPLLQDDDAAPASGGYAEWMPYQKGQAAKAEAAEDGAAKQVTDLAADVDEKFKELGEWLNPRLDGIDQRLAAIAAAPPAQVQA